MPFNVLVTTCLYKGTSFKDASDSCKFSISPNENEKVLFFKIDDGNSNSEFRKLLGMTSASENICDLLIYYCNERSGKSTLYVTESKGKEFDHAARQLINTYTKLKSCQAYKRIKGEKYCENLKLRILCVSNRIEKSTISKSDRAKKEIMNETGIKKNDCFFVSPREFEGTIRSN